MKPEPLPDLPKLPAQPGLDPGSMQSSNPLIPRQLFYGFDAYAFDPESALKNVSDSPKHHPDDLGDSDREEGEISETAEEVVAVVPEKKKKKIPKNLTGKFVMTYYSQLNLTFLN
jgi:hypothetical protein